MCDWFGCWHLFYNSPMESLFLVCNNNKSEDRKDKSYSLSMQLNEVKRERPILFLQTIILKEFKDIEGSSFKNNENLENNDDEGSFG